MAATGKIKAEPLPPPPPPPPSAVAAPSAIIDVYSSDDSDDGEDGAGAAKRRRLEALQVVLPLGFLEPLSPEEEPLARVADDGAAPPLLPDRAAARHPRQFWKAGDYDDDAALLNSSSTSLSVTGMDHVRVHPRFLHSNATSHKWALGAFAELLDNAVDEVRNGAKSVKVDVLENKKVKGKMLLIEDDGGGMDPDKMRQCMSLGYSAKSKIANTIGQYGNGFKTSTMRLGADVIVFSRSNPKDGKRCTQSIGLLSYTFLTSTGKEDIIVPMVDYEKEGSSWKKINRNSLIDWQKNVETIVQWSPFLDEDDLLQQFNSIKDQGTRIIIYNLWEDDEAELELDFNADRHDIQIRGVNRDEKRIEMAQAFPNSRHYLTYQHSLRSYASILYLRLPAGFKIYLRGKVVLHHNLVDDMMLTQDITYRPQGGADGLPKDYSMHAVVTIGFVKDAVHHIDIQGFNVYHKNRLIKPFWRVWNAAGSDGRGVIGVLEADFVEPAHDKQGFERTTALQRLETKLIQIQKKYWRSFCHKIGYARRSQGRELGDSAVKGNPTRGNKKSSPKCAPGSNGVVHGKSASKSGRRLCSSSGSSTEDEIEGSYPETRRSGGIRSTRQVSPCSPLHVPSKEVKGFHSGKKTSLSNGDVKRPDKKQLETENLELTDRLKKMEESMRLELQIEKEKNKSLEARVRELEQQLEQANKEQEALIDIFSDERTRRDNEEENLRIKLKEASKTIQDLLKKVKN